MEGEPENMEIDETEQLRRALDEKIVECDKLRKDMQRLVGAGRQLRERYASLLANIPATEDHPMGMDSGEELERLQDRVDVLASRLQAKGEECLDLKSDLESLHRSGLKDPLEENQEGGEDAVEDENALGSEIDRLRGKIEEKDSELENAWSEIEAWREKCVSLDCQAAGKNQSIAQLQHAIEHLQKNLAEITYQLAEKDGEIAGVQEAFRDAKVGIRDRDNEIFSLQNRLQKMHAERKEREDIIKSSQATD